MTNQLLTLLITSLCVVSPCIANWTTFESANGANSDDFVNGLILTEEDGTPMGTWSLSTTVSNTDFDNYAIHGGEFGLEYVMLNRVPNSDDTNTIEFIVDPNDAMGHTQITISQSPYASDLSWNGGDADTSRFFLNWNETLGTATVIDPNNQLSLNDGDTVNSGTLVQFMSNRAYNSVDAWSIQLPMGARTAEVEWSSSNPQGGSTLTREWVTFNASVSPIPEPSAFSLLGLAALAFTNVLRKRRS